MRVSLPLDPFNKVNSEVATMDLVRLNTDIPPSPGSLHLMILARGSWGLNGC